MMYQVITPYGTRREYAGGIFKRQVALERCHRDNRCGAVQYNNHGRFFKLHYWQPGRQQPELVKTKINRAVYHRIDGEALVKNGVVWTRNERRVCSTPLYPTKDYKYPTFDEAITACSSDKKCGGITEFKKARPIYFQLYGKCRLQGGQPQWDSHVKGSPVTIAYGKYWTILPGYKFEVQGNKKFTTKSDAMSACFENYKKNMASGAHLEYCVGVVKKSENSYFMGKGMATIEEPSSTVWVLGGDEVKYTTASMSYGGYSYDMIEPMRLTGRVDGRRYPNRKKAMKFCNANPKCNGIVRERPHQFYLMGGTSPIPAEGQMAYIKSGSSVMMSRTMWTGKDGIQLKGAYGKRIYTSRDSALKACAGLSGCMGVTKYGSGDFRLRGTTTSASKPGAVSWIEGDSVIEAEDFYWSEKSGYRLNIRLIGTGYPDKNKAFKQCVSRRSQCTGVTKSDGKYYIMQGDGITKTGKDKTFLMGDVVKTTSYMLFANKAWTIKSPYTLDSCYKSFNNLYEAVDRCAEETQCNGVTSTHANHYALCRNVSIVLQF